MPYDPPIIEQLTAGHAPEFREFRLRGLREHPDAFGDSPETFAARPLDEIVSRIESAKADGGGVFAARGPEARMLGVVGIAPDSALKSRHRAFLWGMYVPAEHTGRGVGRALVLHALQHCRNGGRIEQVRLAVTTTNARAIGLYRSLRFVQYGTEPRAIRVDGRDLDEHLMVYEL